MNEIRIAKREDVNEVFNLIVELEDNILDYQSFCKIYFENLCNPRIYYYIYTNGRETVGFVSIHIQVLLHHAAKIAEIQEFIIRKDMRKRGIGSVLFGEAMNIARQNGCSQIEVCCNQKRNESHTFYKRMGMLNNHFKFSKPL
jgi:PhnO protein